MKKTWLLLFVIMTFGLNAQHVVIEGVVQNEDGEGLEAAHIWVEQWDKGLSAGNDGSFRVTGPKQRSLYVIVSYLGYESRELELSGMEDTIALNVQLKADPFLLSQLVVTGRSTGRTRGNEPIPVQLLNRQDILQIGAVDLAESLSFQSGIRVEANCQTCQYTQLRMNGLPGAYSQILMDGRPIFNGLLSLYGLEQIPASLVERLEIIRGGGPLSYGAHAIGGAVNLISRVPVESGIELGHRSAFPGPNSIDQMYDVAANYVSDDHSVALAVFGALRNRDAWDANGDGFSEIPAFDAQSLGTNVHFSRGKHKTALRLWSVHAKRRGGDQLDLRPDEAEQAEMRDHQIAMAALEHTIHFSGNLRSIELFAAGQKTIREHYTGIFGSQGWGSTDSKSWNFGLKFSGEHRWMSWQAGLDQRAEDTRDEIPGYGYLIDQFVRQEGIFTQFSTRLSPVLMVDAGLRLDFHNRLEKPVLTPRVDLLFKMANTVARLGYAQGFKGPQAYEADMHIAFAGGSVSTVQIDPELQRENAHSTYLSVDMTGADESRAWSFTGHLFYTILRDNFILENKGLDTAGRLVMYRTNGQGARVAGLSLEWGLRLADWLQWESACTWQQSDFTAPVNWSDSEAPVKRFLRTPDLYGYSRMSFFPDARFSVDLNGVYTGRMWVPHLAGAPGVESDRLVHTPDFFDVQLALNYKLYTQDRNNQIVFRVGLSNLLNAFQSDFDTGPFRDSNFVYGPQKPRSVFLSIRWNTGY